MWTPSDLLTDLDLLALDRACLTDFGTDPDLLADKRRAACDWAAARVEGSGYTLWRHRTRRTPDAVFGYNGSTYTDYTEAAADTNESDVPLSSILAAPTTHALYVGYRDPFVGLYLGLTDRVNANNLTATLDVWTGSWRGVSSVSDGTRATAGKSLSGGGTVRWMRPDAWVRRTLNNSLLHWARLTVSSSMTATTATTQITPVVPSRLTLPCAQYALGLLYQESYGAARGAWGEKADKFLAAAASMLDVVVPQMADEFDVDESDAVDHTEVSSVQLDMARFSTWERG